MGSRKFVLTIFFSGREADDQNREQTIGAGTTSEVHSTRLTGGRCEATRKRIFALRPFAPRRLPSPPLRHGMAFRFHCMSNSSTRYERRTRHSASIARRILKHALRAARHGISFLHCMSNSSTRGAHNMATSCTRKEWATAVAADIGRLGRDAPILEEHISFSPQCRQSIMMEPARQR